MVSEFHRRTFLKLQKFAFVTNGAFTASATVKIREGEGVTGTVLHTGTWTGIGSNTNNYNEYRHW